MPKKKLKPIPKIIPGKTPPAKTITKLLTNDVILSQEIAVLITELRRANSLRQKLISALLTGFATVLGATLLVTIVIYVLTQLANIEALRPFVEAIVTMVKTSYR